MQVLIKRFCMIVCVLSPLVSGTAYSLSLADGLDHIVDYYMREPLCVYCEPTVQAPTSVTLRGEGFIPELLVHDNCSLRIVEGMVGDHVVGLNDSSILIEGGSIHRLLVFDQSTIEITGGVFRATDCSVYLGAHVNTHVSAMTISGGTFHGVIDMKNYYGQMVIAGGEFHKTLNFEYGTRGLIMGGHFLGRQLEVSGSARLTLYGRDFKVDGAPVSYNTVYEGKQLGQLTGTLDDGTAINTELSVSPTGSVMFVPTPEPATLVILALGGLMLLRRRVS